MENPSPFEVPCGWEFWYHLILVHSPSQFEVPKGVGMLISFHLILVDSPSQFEVPWGWEFWYHMILVESVGQISSSIGVRILISSYPWGQSMSIWSSMGVGSLKFHGVGNLVSPYPCGRSKLIWSSIGVGILISFDIILSMRAVHVNLKFHGGGYLKFHGVGI